MTIIQYAWMIYAAGSLGCTIAAWWMFLWAWRFIRYSAVVTVMVILFTPFAIDPQTMTMAPAIYTLVFDGVSLGLASILPLIKLMVGIWLIGILLVLIFVVLTRGSKNQDYDANYNSPREQDKKIRKNENQPRNNSPRRDTLFSRDLSEEEYQAREELMNSEAPIRAIRD